MEREDACGEFRLDREDLPEGKDGLKPQPALRTEEQGQ